jgi:serine/threonine protein phosphatase 1
MPEMQTLIIGDIHGCADELDALLDAAGPGADDTIIALGDLLDKGPYPGRVYDFFRQTPNAHSIRGNHEMYHIQANSGKRNVSVPQMLTRWKLDDRYRDALAFMKGLPLYMELDDALLVHGYYEPGRPLQKQRKKVLLGLDSGKAYLKKKYDRPWFDLYDGTKPVIVGHKDYTNMQQPLLREGQVYAIDTRCVFGGALTGLLLPSWRMIHIPAREDYNSQLQIRHGYD